jgi:hypothetical protein
MADPWHRPSEQRPDRRRLVAVTATRIAIGERMSPRWERDTVQARTPKTTIGVAEMKLPTIAVVIDALCRIASAVGTLPRAMTSIFKASVTNSRTVTSAASSLSHRRAPCSELQGSRESAGRRAETGSPVSIAVSCSRLDLCDTMASGSAPQQGPSGAEASSAAPRCRELRRSLLAGRPRCWPHLGRRARPTGRRGGSEGLRTAHVVPR